MMIMRDGWENKRKCNLIIIAEDSEPGTFVNVIVESNFETLTISHRNLKVPTYCTNSIFDRPIFDRLIQIFVTILIYVNFLPFFS